MGEIVAKSTAEKVEVQRFRDAPARLTVSLVGPANGSQSFPPAAKRLAVLLLAIWVGRGWRGVVYPPLKNGRHNAKKHCRESATESPPGRPRAACGPTSGASHWFPEFSAGRKAFGGALAG